MTTRPVDRGGVACCVCGRVTFADDAICRRCRDEKTKKKPAADEVDR
jgi:uncharacterized OB-fold protein